MGAKMKTKPWVLSAALCGALGVLPGCALLSKSTPIVPRYFTPELEEKAITSGSQSASEQRLRLGRIQAGKHLRERMAYRTSAGEVGYYQDRRWTEPPASYLERALARSLFEQRGVTRVVSGAAPTLEAELIAFDEVKGKDHRALVEIVMSLDANGVGAVQRTITVEVPVTGADEEDPAPVVNALSQAMSEAVDQICDLVIEQLAQLPAQAGAGPIAPPLANSGSDQPD